MYLPRALPQHWSERQRWLQGVLSKPDFAVDLTFHLALRVTVIHNNHSHEQDIVSMPTSRMPKSYRRIYILSYYMGHTSTPLSRHSSFPSGYTHFNDAVPIKIINALLSYLFGNWPRSPIADHYVSQTCPIATNAETRLTSIRSRRQRIQNENYSFLDTERISQNSATRFAKNCHKIKLQRSATVTRAARRNASNEKIKNSTSAIHVTFNRFHSEILQNNFKNRTRRQFLQHLVPSAFHSVAEI